MARNHGEPIPVEIPASERNCFAALRAYRRRKGQELTVEEFRNRRQWGVHGEKTRKRINRPQTAEGVRAILLAKGLAP